MKNNLLSKIFGFILTSAITSVLLINLFNRKEEIIKEDPKEISIDYETIYIYNKKLPSNISKTLKQGLDGVAVVNDETKDVIVEMQPEIIEQVKEGKYERVRYAKDLAEATNLILSSKK